MLDRASSNTHVMLRCLNSAAAVHHSLVSSQSAHHRRSSLVPVVSSKPATTEQNNRENKLQIRIHHIQHVSRDGLIHTCRILFASLPQTGVTPLMPNLER